MRPDPRSAGMSGARLDRIGEHLEQRYLAPGKIAGALTLVYRKGELAWLEAQGKRDLERDRAMRDDTIFRIYSMTKPITSVALMMLYEEGRFSLQDPVHRYLPAFRDQRVFAGGVYPNFLTTPVQRPMTVRDLLTHMSGLTYDFMARTNVDAAYRRANIRGLSGDDTLEVIVDRLATLPLEFSPGTRWNYSFATDVCGRLVEVLSGQRFSTFLRERILDPLGMSDTDFHVPAEKASRLAACYERGPDKSLRLQDDPGDSRYLHPPTFESGGGGLVGTAHDYLRFCRMLLGGGELDGVRILGRKTIELMTANHLPGGQDLTGLAFGQFAETTYEGYGFGLGFSVNLGPAATADAGSPGEYAWGGAASTVFWVDPVEELIVVFMTQFMPSGTFNFRGQLKSLVYPAIVD
jgi:CubicO group peptidase (beta-lactamase class C family)